VPDGYITDNTGLVDTLSTRSTPGQISSNEDKLYTVIGLTDLYSYTVDNNVGIVDTIGFNAPVGQEPFTPSQRVIEQQLVKWV
jgi:hypothetical protein